MFDPAAVAHAITSSGFTHVVWIPDSSFGSWETALAVEPRLTLLRPTREGEAIALAGGLLLGGATPLVIVQCTGLFEAGDALRNIVHDLRLPLKMIIGVRSYRAAISGNSADNCPTFTEPVLKAWQMPYTLLPQPTLAEFTTHVAALQHTTDPHVLLLGE